MTSTQKSRFWLRRFRSSSFSSDLDVDPNRHHKASAPGSDSPISFPPEIAELRRTTTLRKPQRFRAASTNFVDNYKPLSRADFKSTLEDGLAALRIAPNAFPFSNLTTDCKLMIFAWLSPAERGKAASVCKEWSQLMRAPTLWCELDLITFPPRSEVESGDDDNEAAIQSYEAYRKRTIKFMSFLVTVRPVLRVIRFAFDIGDVRDGWLDVLQTVFRASQCHELEYAELNWNETPAKPYMPDNSSVTWSTNDYKDLMYHHRHRQRFFVKFFDIFTAIANSVSTLILPFDWTDRSLRALNRLPNLDTLVLTKYFVFQAVEQALIDTLFRSAAFLRRLTMEVWTPSGRGLQMFAMRSETLEVLDVSACRGFYLESVDMPRLRAFKASISPMNGPLISSDGFEIPCLLETLRAGAPALEVINDHRLQAGWKEESYEKLDAVMRCVCACAGHTAATPTE